MKGTRAVVLGTNAYPYLILYWKWLFEKVWFDEVDKVYLAISQPVHKRVWAYLSKVLNSNPKIEVIMTDSDWPSSVSKVLKTVDYQSVLIPHDDLFVFKKGVIDSYFKMVEENPNLVVTPAHDIYTPNNLVKELMQRKYPNQLPMVEQETDQKRYSFYCNFTFLSNDLLQKTNYDLNTYYVAVNEYSELLDWTPLTTDISADTNFKFGLELLKAGATFYCPKEIDFKSYMPLSLDYPADYLEQLFLEDSDLFSVPYLHFQTFSYHIGGMLPDYFEYEEIEKIRYGEVGGGAVPHRIENQINNLATRNEVMVKLATIKVMMQLGLLSGYQKYEDYTLNEFKYITEYLGIKENDIDKLSMYLGKLLRIND